MYIIADPISTTIAILIVVAVGGLIIRAITKALGRVFDNIKTRVKVRFYELTNS